MIYFKKTGDKPKKPMTEGKKIKNREWHDTYAIIELKEIIDDKINSESRARIITIFVNWPVCAGDSNKRGRFVGILFFCGT